MSSALSSPIVSELGELLAELHELHFEVRASEYADYAFGNFVLEVGDGALVLRIGRDGGQYYVDGPEEELQAANLWRAFDGKRNFQDALLKWLTRRARTQGPPA